MFNLLCMGLFSTFFARPSPRGRGADVAYDGLAARMYVDVFHNNLLLTLAAVPVESFEQSRVSTGALVGLIEILAPSLERLFTDHGAPVAFHRGVVGGNQLPRDHAFEFVLRRNADHSADRGAQLLVTLIRA